MRRRNKKLCVTLRNKDRLVRLAWHYMAKGWLYRQKVSEAYETLTGEPTWQRDLRIETLGVDRLPQSILPSDEEAWWRYAHDYYKHLAYDCYHIAQQLFMAMSWFAGPQSQGIVGEVEALQVEYAHDPQCLLLREQARARLRATLASPAFAIEETRACFAEMARVHDERTRRRRKHTPRCSTCSGGFGPRPRRCEEGAALSTRATEAHRRANEIIGGACADVLAAWAEYEAARLDVIEHDLGVGQR